MVKQKFKRKVAILYSGGRYFGGIEQYLVNLFNNVNKNEIELELLSLGDWPLTNQMGKENHQVILFSSKRISPSSVRQIGQYLKDNNFNLLVSQGTVANAYARVISLIYKIPNLVTVHSNQGGDYSNPLIRIAYGLIERLTRFPTSRYIVVSNYLKDQMVKSGLPADKIDVIYNGLIFHDPKPKPHKMKVIGSIGRLHPVKGYDLLIQAMAKLSDKEICLKIAGDGAELDRLKVLAKELDLLDRIDFVGFKKDVYEFLNTIDIYVQPSMYEGFGLSVAEAMSQALPVVVTPAGSLKEIVQDGKTGIVSLDFWPDSLADALSKVINNPTLARELGKNAREFVVNNFGIERWVDNTIKAYDDAIKISPK